ncbi:STAS domain-containing protein [Natronosporangium hydrolyticum]|uniref:STAS domain-containing protein n=1 Tax=Natronosporangium hydrolyticum TaxID=2811111 RepID=A0A895YFA0_9ACTN|nr:STAS domain-containing protein [Natronosporangium hydrolyticum]QSB13216.1 STAS domain-containing protein [Natronosporangium hydrolyticum]
MSQTQIPILRIGQLLLAGLPNELDDLTTAQFGEELAERLVSDGARGVLLDISKLEIMDSYAARMLTEIAATARLLGARVVVAGMQPAVAITLVELGLQLPGVGTAMSTEHALDLLTNDRSTTGGEAGHRVHPG